MAPSNYIPGQHPLTPRKGELAAGLQIGVRYADQGVVIQADAIDRCPLRGPSVSRRLTARRAAEPLGLPKLEGRHSRRKEGSHRSRRMIPACAGDAAWIYWSRNTGCIPSAEREDPT